jgi:molybdopterin synthase catalytic subunit
MVALTEDPVSVEEVIESVRVHEAGAIDVFIGTVRNKTGGNKVLRLEYEAYEKMALKEMADIVSEAAQQWPVLKARMVHRVGVLSLGEIAVAIAVATPHRRDAFEACSFMIEEVKKRVPIWKKEFFEGGEVWVAAHP